MYTGGQLPARFLKQQQQERAGEAEVARENEGRTGKVEEGRAGKVEEGGAVEVEEARENEGKAEVVEKKEGKVVEVAENELPNVLVTNDDGINAPGLRALVAALIEDRSCNVFVCAPDSEKSAVSHSITPRDTLEVSSVKIPGATAAFETSGTPADCVSLAFTASLFPWRTPTLVLSGINKGSNCGYHIIYSGTVAGAREAAIAGVPGIALSLDWKRGQSTENDFKVAAAVSLPLIKSALRDIQAGVYPTGCFLNVDVPFNPSEHKGYKVTRQGTSRLPLTWKRQTQERRMQKLKETGIGLQMAQLGLAASAAGAARRATLKKQVPDVESVGAGEEPGKETSQKMFFRLEGSEVEVGGVAPDHDFGALERGYVTITAVGLDTYVEPETRSQVEDWVASVVIPAPPSAL